MFCDRTHYPTRSKVQLTLVQAYISLSQERIGTQARSYGRVEGDTCSTCPETLPAGGLQGTVIVTDLRSLLEETATWGLIVGSVPSAVEGCGGDWKEPLSSAHLSRSASPPPLKVACSPGCRLTESHFNTPQRPSSNPTPAELGRVTRGKPILVSVVECTVLMMIRTSAYYG